MKKMILATLMFAVVQAQAGTFEIDKAHSEVGFSVKHLVLFNAKGNFKTFSGTFDFDEAKGELKNVNVEIDVASVNTNEPDRDKHLVSPDFFDAAKHPKMTFKSTKVEFKDKKPVKVMGTLTMRGVTKPVTLEVDYKGSAMDPWGNTKLGFTAKAKINRKDWGVNWNKNLDKGGVAVSEEVEIVIDAQASAKK
jgi:polyisoprenoid-binding protein YceI